MAVTVQCPDFPLTREDVEGIWQEIRKVRQYPDEEVVVRCVDKKEIRRLNKKYRGKDSVTNVLAFSYPPQPRKASPRGEHDVALCLTVAEEEARVEKMGLKVYTAWLLAHAFLHVTNMDHEGSREGAAAMKKMEKEVLKRRRFLN